MVSLSGFMRTVSVSRFSSGRASTILSTGTLFLSTGTPFPFFRAASKSGDAGAAVNKGPGQKLGSCARSSRENQPRKSGEEMDRFAGFGVWAVFV
jgi:hypothetical protein